MNIKMKCFSSSSSSIQKIMLMKHSISTQETNNLVFIIVYKLKKKIIKFISFGDIQYDSLFLFVFQIRASTSPTSLALLPTHSETGSSDFFKEN